MARSRRRMGDAVAGCLALAAMPDGSHGPRTTTGPSRRLVSGRRGPPRLPPSRTFSRRPPGRCSNGWPNRASFWPTDDTPRPLGAWAQLSKRRKITSIIRRRTRRSTVREGRAVAQPEGRCPATHRPNAARRARGLRIGIRRPCAAGAGQSGGHGRRRSAGRRLAPVLPYPGRLPGRLPAGAVPFRSRPPFPRRAGASGRLREDGRRGGAVRAVLVADVGGLLAPVGHARPGEHRTLAASLAARRPAIARATRP